MKRIVIGVFLMCSFSVISAQSNNGIKLIGGFGGPSFAATKIDGGTTFMMGGGGAAVFSNNFFIGGYGLGTSSMVSNKSGLQGYQDYSIQREYGGPCIGYIYRPWKSVYVTFSLKTGFGDLQLNDKQENILIYDKVKVFTPQIEMDFHLFSVVFFSVGASYDYFPETNLANYTKNDFNKFKINCSFKFGFF